MESKAEKMPSFELITNVKLSIYLIIQKLSVIEVKKRLKKIDRIKALGYDEVHPLVLENAPAP